MEENQLIASILSKAEYVDAQNGWVRTIKINHKFVSSYSFFILSSISRCELYFDFLRETSICFIYISQTMKNCIQFFREKVFFEYIKNFNQERIKKFHLLSDDEFYHKVSTHDSMLLGASYIKPGYDTNSEERKKIIVEFLMSIECIDKKTALHKVGGDDRELVNKSISFTCTNYQPNTYCIELLTNILGVRFKRNKDKLIWEEEECDYVVGLADNYNKSSLFLERQILAILNYFTNNCVQIENWEDNFFL